MSDKELLILAAKGANMGGEWDDAWGEYICPTNKSSEAQFWRPLTDDGDALRLMVKLRLTIERDELSNDLYACVAGSDTAWQIHNGRDRYDATRRAIVRAAAEIGKSLSISPSEGAKRGVA